MSKNIDIEKIKKRVCHLTENELKSSLKDIFVDGRKHVCEDCIGSIYIVAIGRKMLKDTKIDNFKDIEKLIFVCGKCDHRSWILVNSIKEEIGVDLYELFMVQGLPLLQTSVNLKNI